MARPLEFYRTVLNGEEARKFREHLQKPGYSSEARELIKDALREAGRMNL